MNIPQTREAAIEACRASGVSNAEDVARRSWPELFAEHSKPTPGPASVTRGVGPKDEFCFHEIRSEDHRTILSTWARGNEEQSKANADLVAEAFNVLHETGLTPRELQRRCDVLLAALKNTDDRLHALGDYSHHPARSAARNAIASVEGAA